MSVFGCNKEGYPDPTEAEAIAKASKKKYLPLVYICSKYSGDVVTNTEVAKRYSRFAVDQDAIPLAPHLLIPLYTRKSQNESWPCLWIWCCLESVMSYGYLVKKLVQACVLR